MILWEVFWVRKTRSMVRPRPVVAPARATVTMVMGCARGVCSWVVE